MEHIKKYKRILILSVFFFIGVIFGEIHFHNPLSFSYKAFKNIFTEVMEFAEFSYYILASGLIIFAYFQYIDNKRQAKREKVEFAYKLFSKYVDDILILDKKYTHSMLKTLNGNSSQEEKEKFNNLLNKIDTVSAAFTYNLADQSTGYELFGKIFLDQLSSYSPAIQRIYGANYRNTFENIFKLYDSWSGENG